MRVNQFLASKFDEVRPRILTHYANLFYHMTLNVGAGGWLQICVFGDGDGNNALQE